MDELQTLIDKWDLILSTFKEEHEIIDVSFKTWIKPLKIYKLDGNVLTLTFSSLEDDASTDERSIVYIEKRYLKFLEVTVCEVMNKEYQVIIMSSAEKKEDELKKKTSICGAIPCSISAASKANRTRSSPIPKPMAGVAGPPSSSTNLS